MNIFQRIKSTLPLRAWFPDNTPILDAVIKGMTTALQYAYDVFQYARLQTRIKTATGGWLELIAADFLGTSLVRKTGQSDDSYRADILAAMFRKRVTRQALSSVLLSITGRAPIIFEPRRPLDTGAYSGPFIGYGVAGGYGSMNCPAQVFITAYRGANEGQPAIAGYGTPEGAYNYPSIAEYAPANAAVALLQNDAIYKAIDQNKAAGIIVWTRVSS